MEASVGVAPVKGIDLLPDTTPALRYERFKALHWTFDSDEGHLFRLSAFAFRTLSEFLAVRSWFIRGKHFISSIQRWRNGVFGELGRRSLIP